ncbi:MAG: sulfurtransferase [Acidobacteria bacterium]|nr:MAG: sulfurtransferase [Acidobacteriota bacterium]
MNELLAFLLRYGYWLTLGSVFLEQMGLPLPAVPILVGMGALARSGVFSWSAIILVAVAGGLAADLIWYHLGWFYGHSVLRIICRISLEPDHCVRRTENVFVRRGIWALPLAKFIPGLNAAAVPLAGMIKTRLGRFLIFDTSGLLLWTGAYAGLGYVFGHEIGLLIAYSSRLGNSLLLIGALAIMAYVGYKYVQRQRFLKALAMDRITPEELKSKMDSNQKIVVVDLRNQLDVNTDRYRIPGAFHAVPELLEREAGFPRNQEVILYCT